MCTKVRLFAGLLVFLTGLYFACSDLAAHQGFGDALAWIFSAVAALIFFVWIFEKSELALAVSGLFGVVAFICGVTSLLAHSSAANPSLQKAYFDLVQIAAYSANGNYGNKLTSTEQTILNRMVVDCGLQGAQNDLNLAQQVSEAQAFGPTTSIVARSAGALTPNNPQICQHDYEQLDNVAPEFFGPYQKDLEILSAKPKFLSW